MERVSGRHARARGHPAWLATEQFRDFRMPAFTGMTYGMTDA